MLVSVYYNIFFYIHRCPYLGCQNKTPLDPQDLLEAVDFKREIAKMKQSELW